jgi:hypothetical protein
MRSIKEAGLFIWRNLDAVFVIVVGLAVAVLQVVGRASEGAVDAAILGLLAVMAVILLRTRQRRGELDEVKEVARDALSERPFQMVWAKNEWDIQTRDRAVITSTRQVRFIHDRVSTMEHWSDGDGTVVLDWKVERETMGRFPNDHERVSLRAGARSDHPRQMRVVWPRDSPPSNVELRYRGNPGSELSPNKKAGRMEVVERVPRLAVGEVVEIRWFW